MTDIRHVRLPTLLTPMIIFGIQLHYRATCTFLEVTSLGV